MNIAGRPLRYWVGSTVLKALGWEVEGSAPTVSKYVLVAAPHTTGWDLPITLGVGYVLGLDVTWIGKHTLFEPPWGGFFRWLGGVPVDRRSSLDQVQQMVELIHSRERIALVIAPEGTRGQTSYWKSGFYWIARGAEVPIALGYLDYRRRRGGVGPMFLPGESLDEDVQRIRNFYATVTAKHPEHFSNIRLRARDDEGTRRDRAREKKRRGRVRGLLRSARGLLQPLMAL